MRYNVDGQVVLLRAPEGPLAAYIKQFAASLSDQGYATDSIHRQVLIAVGFSQWLKRQDVALRSITPEHPSRYLRYRARRARPSQGDAAALNHLLTLLRGHGAIPAEKISVRWLTPAERCAEAYKIYLRDVRGLAKATIVNYVPFICTFLDDRFGGGPLTLSQLRADDVARFVQQQASDLHRKRAKLLTTALRSFSGMRVISVEQSWIWRLRCPPWPTGRCHRYPERLELNTSVSCWPASTGAPRWDAATTLSCSCSRDWGCVPVKWRLSNSITLTGTPDS
jgi:hypothetical protein